MLIPQLIYTTMWIIYKGMTKYKICGDGFFFKHMSVKILFPCRYMHTNNTKKGSS